MPEFHAIAPQATVSEGLPRFLHGAGAGVKPVTLRTKGVDSTNVPHTHHNGDCGYNGYGDYTDHTLSVGR